MITKTLKPAFRYIVMLTITVSILALNSSQVTAKNKNAIDDGKVTTYKGKVVDKNTMETLVFATVAVEGTNVATVTNVEGKFALKIPNESKATQLKVTFIGYETASIKLSDIKSGKFNVLKMNPVTVEISEINVFPKDPIELIHKVMNMRSQNYMNQHVLMTAFYRETIQKRKTYVGLSEAVVQVHKASYTSSRNDLIKLFKGRKSADSKKLDTILFKLQGGPHSTLALDIVKDPYMILDDEVIDLYSYKITNITRVDGKLNYVIDFKQRPHVTQPLFFGKIYIDVDNYAISSVAFNLNTENKYEAGAMFIKKKPIGVNVYPTTARYIVNYREQDGKWQFNYSRGEVTFKVNWKKKVFSTNYTTMVEMAVTDWELAAEKPFKASDRLKMNVIMNEAVSGFANDGFWGNYNIIEPEQSIEVAIKKIRKKLDKIE